MEQEEQQNHQSQKHQTGDHEDLERNHKSQQVSGKGADTKAGGAGSGLSEIGG